MKADVQHTHAQSTIENPLSGSGVTLEIMKRYLAYLVAVGFLESPGEGKLPAVKLGEGQREALSTVGGRGGLV
jgi:L-aminoadipate-semialdehyde dehydrogenase